MSLTYTIEGFDLHQPSLGVKLLQQTQFASNVSPRRVNIVIPGVHGEIPAWNDPLSSSTIIFRVRIEDRDPAQLEQKWNYLRSLCRVGSNSPVTLRRESENGFTSTFAQLESMDRPDFHCAAGMVTTTMSFHCPSGRWQDINATEQQLSIPGTDQTVVFASESSGPVTDAMVRVQGPLGTLEVRDNTNNTGFEWTAPGSGIPAGEYLLVNCADFTAWHKLDDAWENGGTNVGSTLQSTGNGMLALVPDVGFTLGSNSSSVTVTAGGTTASSQMHILGRRTYI